jgi:zinc protease
MQFLPRLSWVRRSLGRTSLVLGAVALLGATPLLVAGCFGSRTSSAKVPRVNLEFEKYTLANGLEVILRKDSRLPLVAVNLWYHVGPANESAGRTGFAHLFEHMMFQGSGHIENDSYFAHLEGAGASFVNGTTGFDRTNYMEDLPSNQLELALWLESDRMGFLLDRLDEGMLANQQDVVRNERRQSLENAPYGLPEEELYHLLFPKGHPYYASIIGSHEDIQAANLQDVRQFFKDYYAPNNASLAIVGDIDVEKTKQLVEKYFGTIAKGADVPAITVQTPPITQERRAVVTDRVELPRLYMAWLTDPIFKPGDAEAMVLAQILGKGKASRLYKRLVYDLKIAQDASADQSSLLLGSVFGITVTAKPNHTVEELEAEVDAQLDSMATAGPTAEELESAKNAILSSIVMSLENLGGFNGVADRFNYYNHFLDDPGYLNKDLERIAAVTAEQVRQIAAQKLQKTQRVVVHAVPGEKVIPAEPPTPPAVAKNTVAAVESAEPWRKQKPAPGPASTAPLPSAKTFKLDNGLTVYLVESHALPVVSAHLQLRSGSAADPGDKPGLAGFTVAMLDEGTKTRDALGIAREIESLGAKMGSGTVADGSHLWVKSLTSNVEKSMNVLADVVLNPTFPDHEIERVRNDRRTAVVQERDNPVQTAIRVTTGCLFGNTHPYGHVPLGTEQALMTISKADLTQFYTGSFGPENAALVLAGDLDEAQAQRLAKAAFGTWKGSGTPIPPPTAGTRIPERVVIVDKPTSPQTMVLLAQQGVMRSDPDFEKLDVMNQILGGLFSSRLNLNLREKHGFSYGAFSAVVQRRGVAPIYAGASVRSDATGRSVEESLKEIRSMLEKEVSAQELELAKESIARSLPALFETSESTVATIGSLYLFDLPPDYYQGLPSRLDAMTAAEVYEATQRRLKPEDMLVVAVGDRKSIEPQLAKLNLGPITHRTPDGGVPATAMVP